MISTPIEAVAMALALAITAPTEELARECAQMAEVLAVGLSDLEVQRAKRAALVLVEKGLVA